MSKKRSLYFKKLVDARIQELVTRWPYYVRALGKKKVNFDLIVIPEVTSLAVKCFL